MLKNVSGNPITLQWDGVSTLLLPGQTCRYNDPKIEQRMTWKHGSVLQLVPDAVKEAEKPPLVVVDDAPSDDESGDPVEEAKPKRGRPKKK